MLSSWMQKLKSFLSENKKDLLLSLLVFLISSASFGLGRLSALIPEGQPVVYEEPGNNAPAPARGIETVSAATPPPAQSQNGDGVVASKNGSAYHLPSCPGAKKIKDENKITFSSAAEAKKLGYRPAANCSGLQ